MVFGREVLLLPTSCCNRDISASAIADSIKSPDVQVQNTDVRKTQLNPELAQRNAGKACMAVNVAKMPQTNPSATQVREAFFIFVLLPVII